MRIGLGGGGLGGDVEPATKASVKLEKISMAGLGINLPRSLSDGCEKVNHCTPKVQNKSARMHAESTKKSA